MKIYKKVLKRPLDIILSLIGIVLLSPIMLVGYTLVRLTMGSPILFKQQRPGRFEKLFTLYKFRTMNNAWDATGHLLPSTQRVTTLGRILRSTSIDELPSLFNVVKGEMSLIGPRPLLVEYLQLYDEKQRKRHNIRPGITGLAQITGRNNIEWEKRLNLDVEYTNNISFINDMKIIFLTVHKVIHREGITKSENIIMEKFRGNAED